MDNPETFSTLVRDLAHWEFELFVSLVWMIGEAVILWPIIRAVRVILKHHKVDDADIADLKKQVARLQVQVDLLSAQQT